MRAIKINLTRILHLRAIARVVLPSFLLAISAAVFSRAAPTAYKQLCRGGANAAMIAC